MSVGEVAIALKLAAKLKELDPKFFCVLTTTTTTGFAFATQEAATRTWKFSIARSISGRSCAGPLPLSVRSASILVEAEVWPNLAAEARQRGIPLALVNARLSQRSERRFRRFRIPGRADFSLSRSRLRSGSRGVERWVALGVPRERIHHVGSIKYDPAESG